MIPYGRQEITEEDIKAVVEVLNSDFLTQGPKVPEFEKLASKYCNSKYAVAVNSATSALHISCLALGVKKGDIVWTAGSDINSINSNLKKIAKKYGLNNDKVSGCLNSEELEEEILSNRIDVHKKYSIKSTPTILINENEYDGKHEYKALKKEIERFL